jgi:hypothetical protein
MMNLALIDAFYHGAIFLFIVIGVLGMFMEMALKR